MTTQTLTSKNDTVDFITLGLKGSINGGLASSMAGVTLDAGAGFDVLTVHDTSTSPNFALTIADTGVVTITNASGSASFVNFEKVIFSNITLDLGSTGNDSITSTSATGDALYGFAGNDTLTGGAGADTLYGGSGNDTYYVSSAKTVVVEAANQGTDTVYASINYGLTANVENLTLTGTGNINATGNALNNVIIGNAGNNVIAGGAGQDIMTGGAGKDLFVFNSIHDTTTVAATRDVITDFTHLVDRIDLHAIDANTKIAGDQAFTFQTAAGAHFTGAAGQLHYFYSGANTIVEGDINGDKVADFQIQLTGHLMLTAVDFVL